MALTRAQAYHNLAVLLAAGVPISKSLLSAASGAKPGLQRAFADLSAAAAGGDGLAETMAKYPGAFAPLDVLLVRVGEESGELAESLEALSAWHVFCDRLRRTVVAGLALPVVILHAAAVVAPAPGLILGHIGLAGYLVQVAAVLAFLYVPAGAILAVVRLTPPTGPARRAVDALTLRIPLLGGGVRRLALGRYCRAFHALHKSGAQVVQSAEMSAGATGNAVVAGWLGGGADSARAGSPVSEGFSAEVPRDFLDVWRIGEESGTLAEAADRLARINLELAEDRFVALGTWLPRVIYLLICVYMAYRVITSYGVVMPMTR